jgi:4-hydroxybenzoate polyprenyltransferase
MKYLKLFVFSNLFIACAAGLMMMQTCMIFNLPATELSWLTFFGTLFLYNFHRLYRFRKSRLVKDSRYQWVINHRSLLVILSLISVAGAFFFTQKLRLQSFVYLLVLCFIALGYVIEFIGKKPHRKALRDLPGLKIFIIALVWSLFMVGLPSLQFDVVPENVFLVLTEKCFFIFAITVPFDIRDQHFDKAHQKTLPQLLGTNGAVAAGMFAILISITLCIVVFIHNTYNLPYLISQLIAYGFSAWLIFLSKKTRNELFYSFLVDGTIILSALGAFLLS